MSEQLLGIHHVTAIAGDAQRNLSFYRDVLGLVFVKKTVNFDDPFTYHFYFGDEIGRPGTLLTFFPWSSTARMGRQGTDQISSFAFVIPSSSIEFWKQRLEEFRVPIVGVSKRFGDDVVTASDPDGFTFELVGVSSDERSSRAGPVPGEHMITGLHSVTLSERSAGRTISYLTEVMGFHQNGSEGERARFELTTGGKSSYVEIVERPDDPPGRMGAGIIHHVAFRTTDGDSQVRIRGDLLRHGSDVTPVIDRNYFHSIYFHEPGGVLFEVATDGPGFLTDESQSELGSHLKLPLQYESSRSEIEKHLPPLR